MTPEQFCYWLQGFFELSKTENLSTQQVNIINEHLQLVFNKVTGKNESCTKTVDNTGWYGRSAAAAFGLEPVTFELEDLGFGLKDNVEPPMSFEHISRKQRTSLLRKIVVEAVSTQHPITCDNLAKKLKYRPSGITLSYDDIYAGIRSATEYGELVLDNKMELVPVKSVQNDAIVNTKPFITC